MTTLQPTILIAEDDTDIRNLLRMMLTRAGFNVDAQAMDWPINCSMAAIALPSDGPTMVIAVPDLPARPVRPIRRT